MNKKLALSVITFSGIVAVLSNGIEAGIMYVINIALVSLCCMYMAIKKNNEKASIIKQR